MKKSVENILEKLGLEKNANIFERVMFMFFCIYMIFFPIYIIWIPINKKKEAQKFFKKGISVQAKVYKVSDGKYRYIHWKYLYKNNIYTGSMTNGVLNIDDTLIVYVLEENPSKSLPDFFINCRLKK